MKHTMRMALVPCHLLWGVCTLVWHLLGFASSIYITVIIPSLPLLCKIIFTPMLLVMDYFAGPCYVPLNSVSVHEECLGSWSPLLTPPPKTCLHTEAALLPGTSLWQSSMAPF